MNITNHQINVKDAFALSEEMLKACEGIEVPTIEYALVIAYARVAQGVRTFPESTREARFWRFIEHGAAALVNCLMVIETISDADMKMWDIQRRALHKATSGVQ